MLAPITLYSYVVYVFLFFFKQKTAYERRISDWSSDVCSSDLVGQQPEKNVFVAQEAITRKRIGGRQGHRQGNDRVEGYVNQAEIGRASCRERVCQYV